MGDVYALRRGVAYLSYWVYGVGVSANRDELAGWFHQRDLEQRRPATVAAELGVHYTLAEHPG